MESSEIRKVPVLFLLFISLKDIILDFVPFKRFLFCALFMAQTPVSIIRNCAPALLIVCWIGND